MEERKSNVGAAVIICLVIIFVVLAGLVYQTISLTNKVDNINGKQRRVLSQLTQTKTPIKRAPIKALLVEKDIEQLGGFLTLSGEPGNQLAKFKLINASEWTINFVTVQINFHSDREDSNQTQTPYDLYTFHFFPGIRPGETGVQSVKIDYDWSNYPKHTWKIYAAEGSWQLP